MSYTVQYYDLVLAAIFVTMGIGVSVGLLTSVPLPAAVIGSGLIAVLIIAHSLFVNGPVDGPEDLTDEVETLN